MEMLAQLWLPILVAAAAVWFWNFLSWSILPIHKGDWGRLQNEDAVISALRSLNLSPGAYIFPKANSTAECKTPEFQAKWKTGPAGMLNIWPAKSAMGGKMIASFVVYLIASIFIAYIGHHAFAAKGVPFAKIMQVLGTAGVLAYTFAALPSLIWFNGTPSAKLAMIIDGLVTGLGTGAIFAALWPK